MPGVVARSPEAERFVDDDVAGVARTGPRLDAEEPGRSPLPDKAAGMMDVELGSSRIISSCINFLVCGSNVGNNLVPTIHH